MCGRGGFWSIQRSPIGLTVPCGLCDGDRPSFSGATACLSFCARTEWSVVRLCCPPSSVGEYTHVSHGRDGNRTFGGLERPLPRGGWWKVTVVSASGSARLGAQALDGEADRPLAYPVTDNLVEGKRKRRSNISSPATHTASSSSSTTPTRKVTESPRASTGAVSGKRKLITSEEDRSPAKRGRKSATVKPGEGPPGRLPQTMAQGKASCWRDGVGREAPSPLSWLQSWRPSPAHGCHQTAFCTPSPTSQQSAVGVDRDSLDRKHQLTSL